jgi:hypothetical membrane protein
MRHYSKSGSCVHLQSTTCLGVGQKEHLFFYCPLTTLGIFVILKNEYMKIKIYVLSYLILILVMFLLPFFSSEGYSIVKNTTSQLGAQKTPHSWIMNLTFVLMGFSSVYAGWSHFDGYWMQRILLLIFGISLMLVAFFNHKPIDSSLDYSMDEDKLHSLFAAVTGFSFTILAISTGFIKDDKSKMILPIVIGIVATFLSLLMFKLDNYSGIWQRLMFIITFGWMIYEFKE